MSKPNMTKLGSLAGTVAAVVGALGVMAPHTAAASTPPPAVSVATDWTAASPNTATGMLLGTPVTLTGTHVWGAPQSTLDGSATYFATSVFSPALAKSDAIQIAGGPDTTYSYAIDFGGATVTDPIFEVGSLGSRIDFPTGTQVKRLSGDGTFTLSGSTVSGTATNTIGASGMADSSGTIRLTGTFTRITFTTRTNYSGPEDGILIQLGVALSE